MDFTREIADFASRQIGGILIVEKNTDRLVYLDNYVSRLYPFLNVGDALGDRVSWIMDAPELSCEVCEWESVDTDRYLMIYGALFSKDSVDYRIYKITDNTLFMNINKDVSSYMGFFKKLSAFQNGVLNNLSGSPYDLVPLISDYLHFQRIVISLCRNGFLEILTFDIDISDDIANCFEYKRLICDEKAKAILSETTTDLKVFIEGNVDNKSYSVFVRLDDLKRDVNNAAVQSVLSLCIQNGIMREQLLYNSEHDMLTGLYNKGKYLEKVTAQYRNLNSIGLINLDVNNLKMMNDTYGHEAGDRLIIKAADSIRKVSAKNVHCYRIGGDEFLVVCCDISRDGLELIKVKWEAELSRLNAADDGINCVIASGVAYAEAPYDYDSLSQLADERMYLDKKLKKENRLNDNK